MVTMHEKQKYISIKTESGAIVSAIAPEILSASRSTDIPAFYSQWFFKRLHHGYCTWTNPFNRKVQYVSFENVKAIVFWTKYPEPIFPYLHILDQQNIDYYFLYSLNNYENEKLEPYVPSLEKRVASFIKLSSLIGKHRVLWRFDPILVSDSLSQQEISYRIKSIGDKLYTYTNKLIFSFIEIDNYKKVRTNLKHSDDSIRELTNEEKYATAHDISHYLQQWKQTNPEFHVASCATPFDFSQYNIAHNACIDFDLLNRINTKKSSHSLFQEEKYIYKKDSGQRKNCLCGKSKDIGAYSTCPHLCRYCYANISQPTVLKNSKKHNPDSESII